MILLLIYKATNKINGKGYIGQTVHNLNKRKSQHERSHTYGETYALTLAIKKYGTEAFEWEVLDYASDIDELNAKEVYYIKKHKTLTTEWGYNLKGGGGNAFLTEEVKRKIGQAQMGEKNHMWGVTGANNHSSRRVINLSTGRIYDSATMCAKEEGLNLSHLCATCRGDRGSINNTVYRYVDGNNNPITPTKTTKKKTTPVVNIDTGEVFESAVDAEKFYLGKKTGNLTKVCKGKRERFAGYSWKYFDCSTMPTPSQAQEETLLKV